jgi:DNA-binding NarL/FixJ family response regulator
LRPRAPQRLLSVWRSAELSLAERGPIKVHHDACEQRARFALGQARYTEAFQAGTRLSPKEAITYALGGAPATASMPNTATALSQAALTRRQAEIAALVAEGLSDREIATQLVLSERIVSGHVGQVLAKLGFTRRTQIAAWIVAQDSPPDTL